MGTRPLLGVRDREPFSESWKQFRELFSSRQAAGKKSLPEGFALYFRITTSGLTLCSAQYQLSSAPLSTSALLFLFAPCLRFDVDIFAGYGLYILASAVH